MNINRFIEEYDSRIEAILNRFKVNGYKEDLKQEIYQDIIGGGYLNLYDPNKGSMSTFIYAIVKDRIYRHWSKSNRDILLKASTFYDEECSHSDRKELEHNLIDRETEQELNKALAMAKQELHHIPERGRKSIYDRSYHNLFELLERGKSRKEIALEMRLSEASICLRVKELRNLLPELKEYWSAV
jgi:RNA polymerase sigma factor, sigma-70 family